jgi:hypothetical protein
MNIVEFDTYKFVFLSKQDRCKFFQWIDGPETFDPQILLFSYDRNESSPLRSFKRWVPQLPNPPPMTNEEKDEASTYHVHNPPACKCGYCAELVNPFAGLDYTPFFHCPIPLSVILFKRLYILLWSKYWVYVNDIDMCCVLQGNKRGCDFNELIYGPMSHWPNDLQLLLSLDSYDLPCHYAPDPLYHCSVPARQGVVPSELGYDYFCDNVIGEDDAWVSSY